MYDPHSEAHEFVGHDRAEAMAKATAYFGCREEDLRIAQPEAGTVHGLGARVVLVAYPKDARPPRRSESGGGSPEPRRAREGREGRRDDGRGRGSRGGRGGREDRRGERHERHGERAERREPRGDEEGRRRRPASETEAGPSIGTTTGPLGEVGEFVKGLIERMEVGSFEIGESGENPELVVLQIRGAATARLVEGEGRTVDAMQLIANQAALRAGGEDAKRVVLDVEGDADQRAAYLARVAERAASRARETGRPVALEAMNPKDRRTVHVALREVEGIATMSVGDGRYRQVVVVPDSAPEYEEAKRYEQQSQRESHD
jgi:spoIIIJ-associated protein